MHKKNSFVLVLKHFRFDGRVFENEEVTFLALPGQEPLLDSVLSEMF